MKIFAAGIITETNTFSPMPTGLADFDVIRAADLTPDQPSAAVEIEVFRQHSQEQGWPFVFSLYAVAEPAGLTVRSVYENLRDELLADLKAALHGAMVAEGYDDCEGDLTAHVRQIVGPDVVIGVELDLHCHLTQHLVDQADLITIYKEYPHNDFNLDCRPRR